MNSNSADKLPEGDLSATWTLFCVGCNQRFPCGSNDDVCPNCGHQCTFNDTSSDETIISRDADEEGFRAIAQVVAEDDPLIGKTLHVYQCVSLIGSGGMGRVYLAHHNDLERRCALKLLFPRRATCDEEYVARFVEEGRAAAALVHPNIVTVHAVGQVDGKHFLEMEFISGRSLQQLINDEGQLTVPRALSLIARTADGLAAAHRNDIIHRDVKPDNIMLTKRGEPKISDFGLAKRVLNSKGKPIADGICGTPNYMAPELFQGESASAASDVYALGVTLFLALTGRLPYQAESLQQLRWKGRNEPIPNVRRVRSDVPLEVAECVAMMTSPAPGNRPKDAIEASQLLHAVLGQERDLESLLIEAFRHHPGITWTRSGDSYTLVRTLPDNRSQTVFLEPSGHAFGDRLLLFYSICGPAQHGYFEQALRLNSEMLHGSLAIREIDGAPYFVVVDTYPRSTVDPEEIRRTVFDIAQNADRVEQRLTGLDRH
ncbi:MAG: protein kinase [Rhodopirellula sp.]|nr:protein kinase [Rhodopirellula sp.]